MDKIYKSIKNTLILSGMVLGVLNPVWAAPPESGEMQKSNVAPASSGAFLPVPGSIDPAKVVIPTAKIVKPDPGSIDPNEVVIPPAKTVKPDEEKDTQTKGISAQAMVEKIKDKGRQLVQKIKHFLATLMVKWMKVGQENVPEQEAPDAKIIRESRPMPKEPVVPKAQVLKRDVVVPSGQTGAPGIPKVKTVKDD